MTKKVKTNRASDRSASDRSASDRSASDRSSDRSSGITMVGGIVNEKQEISPTKVPSEPVAKVTYIQLTESQWRKLAVADLESLLAYKERKIHEKELALLMVDINNKQRVGSQKIFEHNIALRAKAEIIEEITNCYNINPRLGFEYDIKTGEITVNHCNSVDHDTKETINNG